MTGWVREERDDEVLRLRTQDDPRREMTLPAGLKRGEVLRLRSVLRRRAMVK